MTDEEIARHLQAAIASGELATAESWGRPLAEDAGWEATPEGLRMPFKILKNAGYAPPELGLFHERACLRAALAAAGDEGETQQRLQRELAELEQRIALRLESLRRHASL
ncbi:DnaJ family domain-containing protein [Roseateles violae]|uniref:DUF1992 domain-containing protein n=1 Tax=Roseateles violae TaxID=3058042 RepID=A0ABT8DKQ9_9BURK|nr:DnaJ family domain-containing protein [Pelomonas sp. PFR6]MDN3919000.1 DUF1992 domain-containing protein [Pelomonas sp. PFR6]